MPKRIVFREKALQHYVQQREKTVLPVWVTPPTFLILWLLLGLLGLLLLAGLVTELTEVPVTTSGVGIIQADEQQSTAPTALIFLPSSHTIALQPNMPVLIQIKNVEPIKASVTSVVPGLVSPSDARNQIPSGNPCQLSIQGPSVVLTAQLDAPTPPLNIINGGCGIVQIKVGTSRLLPLLTNRA